MLVNIIAIATIVIHIVIHQCILTSSNCRPSTPEPKTAVRPVSCSSKMPPPLPLPSKSALMRHVLPSSQLPCMRQSKSAKSTSHPPSRCTKSTSHNTTLPQLPLPSKCRFMSSKNNMPTVATNASPEKKLPTRHNRCQILQHSSSIIRSFVNSIQLAAPLSTLSLETPRSTYPGLLTAVDYSQARLQTSASSVQSSFMNPTQAGVCTTTTTSTPSSLPPSPCSSPAPIYLSPASPSVHHLAMSPESSNSPPPPQSKMAMLPPCRVCGERSSGYHYGVNTCEACKVREHIDGIAIVK